MLPGAELRQESIWMASHDSLHCVHVATEIVKILLVPGNKGDISGVGTANVNARALDHLYEQHLSHLIMVMLTSSEF